MRLVEVIDDSVSGCHIPAISKWWLEFDEKGYFKVAVGLDQRDGPLFWGPFCRDCRKILDPLIERGRTMPENPTIQSQYLRHSRTLNRRNGEHIAESRCQALLLERRLALQTLDKEFLVTDSNGATFRVVPLNAKERWHTLWVHLAYSPPIQFCRFDSGNFLDLIASGYRVGRHLQGSFVTYFLEIDSHGNILRSVGTSVHPDRVVHRAGCVSPLPPRGNCTWPLATDGELAGVGPLAELRQLMWQLIRENPAGIDYIDETEFEAKWEMDRGD